MRETTLPIEAETVIASPLLEEKRMRSADRSAAEQRVARFVLASPDRVMEISVSDLAVASETSVGTVVRFCQRLGLRGYQDLKLKLAREVSAASTLLPKEALLTDPWVV
ncbi:MurR/RpiR family transcriptional regulator [Tomitella biformata]|uniref:MurR/RpiR family transcriptional regulator n=1 Tax=Tomitella biformata TaxID=630403 RepID=UPI0004640F3A|nr:MurR/RpiR family transcriptional regulator [Tomitella biformata]